jgi:hypothetical protein
MRRDLAVAHLHDVDGLELDSPTGGRDAEERAFMCAVVGLERRDAVSIGDLPMNDGVKVGKGGPQGPVELACTGLVGRAARLRRVVKEVVRPTRSAKRLTWVKVPVPGAETF